MCFLPCAHLTPGCDLRNGTRVVVPSDGARRLRSGRGDIRLATVRQSVWLRVVAFGPPGPIPFDRLAIDFALDGNQRVEKLVGDVSEHGGATRGDTILNDEDEELGKELVDLLGGLQVVELTEEVGGKVDLDGLS